MKLKKYDPTGFFKSEEDISACLNAALEESDPAFFMSVLGDVTKARGMTDIASETGFARQ